MLLALAVSFAASAQQAAFSFTRPSECALQTVTFKDESTGNITKWTWDFGNGTTTYTTATPTVSNQYITPGTYTVTLTVSNGTNSNVVSKEIVVYAGPVVTFHETLAASKCAPRSAQFVNESKDASANALTYQWIFGDGGSSTEKNPAYTYASPGNYNVTLLVANEHGCNNVLVKNNEVEVLGPSPAFTAESDGLCSPPSPVAFNATFENGKAYEWDFGDGSKDTGKEITHLFQNKGQFNINLTVTDENGCKAQKSRKVFVGGENGADFTPSAEVACIGAPVTFTQSVTGIVESYTWDFGDGTTESAILNPEKQFAAAGVYTITLTVFISGKECASVASKQMEVVDDPIADFEFKPTCTTEIAFKNISKKSTAWEWTFESEVSTLQSPIHKFTIAPAEYVVSLKAFNAAGCFATIEKTIGVKEPVIASTNPGLEQDCDRSLSLAGCAPYTLSVNNTSTSGFPIKGVLWNFGDGSSSNSKDVNIKHDYPVGKYQLTLTVVNSIGCQSIFSAKVNVADRMPTASFSVPTSEACVSEEVVFVNNSTDADFFCWDFGDGTDPVVGENVAHVYDHPGVYDVTLKAKNAGCENSITIPGAVTVKDPYAGFEIVKNCELPFKINFSNTSANYDKFVWDFGDGFKDSTHVNPVHEYAALGNYDLSLKVSKSTTGCEVKFAGATTIQVIKAGLTVDKTHVCLGDAVLVQNSSVSAATWYWDLGIPDSQFPNVPGVTTTYNTPGVYNLILRALDSDSCPDSAYVAIEVLNFSGAFSSTAASICEPDINSTNDYFKVSFKDETLATPGLSGWSWNFGDGTESETQNPEHNYTAQGVYTVSVRLKQSEEKYCDLVRPNYIVYVLPGVDFVLADTTHCIGLENQFENRSTGLNTYEWIFGDGTTSTEVSPRITNKMAGTFDVSLKAKDGFGCEKIITKPAMLTITKPDAFFTSENTFRDCPPLAVDFNSTGSGPVSWVWTFGDEQISNLKNPKIIYQRPGAYNVTLIASDENECTDTTTVEKAVTVLGPDGTISVSPIKVCAGDTVNYLATAQNTETYIWDFGDGIVLPFTESEVRHQYSNAGEAHISAVFEDANGCRVAEQEQFVITIHGKPEVSFSYKPDYPFQNEEILFAGISPTAAAYEWIIDGHVTQTDANTAIRIDNVGLQAVTFRGIDEFGCTQDTTIQIFVQADIDFIPNIFTPNDDELNKSFEIPRAIDGFWNLHVYNRWGELVYKQKNYRNTWQADGLSSGVYYYILSNAYRDRQYKGYVHVVY
jgi:PKD repeat protein